MLNERKWEETRAWIPIHNAQDLDRELLKIQRELMVDSDRVQGIISEFKDPPGRGRVANSRSRPILIRDATRAIPLEQRIPPDDHPDLLANNTLLRGLSTLRGVSHLISKTQGVQYLDDLKEVCVELEQEVKKIHAKFTEDPRDKKNKKKLAKLKKRLLQCEEIFNFVLLKILSEAGLLGDIENKPKALTELLSFCRYAAASLDPTPIVETTTRIGNRAYTETCYPLTKKTPAQKSAIKEAIPKHSPVSLPNHSNFYNALPHQLQLATWAFRDRFLDDRCGMSASMRHYMPYGIKNAFTVQKTIAPINPATGKVGNPTAMHWSSRSATLVYVGDGESKMSMQAATDQNLEQLHAALSKEMTKQKNFAHHSYIKILDTNTSYRTYLGPLRDEKRQDRMVKMAKKAVGENGPHHFSYFPVNTEGRTHIPYTNRDGIGHKFGLGFIGLGSLFLLSSILTGVGVIPLGAALGAAGYLILTSCIIAAIGIFLIVVGTFSAGNPLNAASRAMLAAQHGLHPRDGNNRLITHNVCAGGQDRTGIQALMESYLWLQEQGLDKKQILTALVGAGHNATMAHILCLGSPGQKSESRVGRFFGEYDEHVFLESAQTSCGVPLYDSLSAFNTKYIQKIAVGVMLLITILPPLLGVEVILSAGTPLAIMGLVSAGLILFGGLTFAITRWQKKDLLAGFLGASLFMGVVLSTVAIVGRLMSKNLFVAAVKGLTIGSMSGLSLMLSAVPLVCVAIRIGYWIGGKLGKAVATDEFIPVLARHLREPRMVKSIIRTPGIGFRGIAPELRQSLLGKRAHRTPGRGRGSNYGASDGGQPYPPLKAGRVGIFNPHRKDGGPKEGRVGASSRHATIERGGVTNGGTPPLRWIL